MGIGNMFQSNQAFEQFVVTGGESGFFADKVWLFGAMLACLVGIVIIGGIRVLPWYKQARAGNGSRLRFGITDRNFSQCRQNSLGRVRHRD